MVGGIACSGSLIATGVISARGFVVTFIGLMWFFFVLRLMDELKDYRKDLIAHPERPLPRGLLKPEAVERAIRFLVLGMVVFALAAAFVLNPPAGICFLVITGWLWLMYREFYLGEWLVERPLLYAVSHQLILLPVCAFAVLVHDGGLVSSPPTWFYGLCVLGAFFSYEICRKLDPGAHPLLKTYLSLYGPPITALLVVATNAIAAFAARNLALRAWLWPFELLTLASLIVLFVAPDRYKLTEGTATLSLLFHIWGVSFAHGVAVYGVHLMGGW